MADTGIGIPKHRIDSLFQTFSQVDSSTTRKYGGTGLGLAISKRLTSLMGGRIWVESEGIPGLGSAFHFTIVAEPVADPRSMEARQMHMHMEAPKSTLEGKRLLVIERSPTNCQILKEYATSWGMNFSSVASISDALPLIHREPFFDLAIMNLRLPATERIAFASHLQALKPLPLVALTVVSARSEAADFGPFEAQITIPIKPFQLYQAMNDALGIRTGSGGSHGRKEPSKEKLADSMPLRILLAEDNVINQRVAQQLLHRLGYSPDLAVNGLEVLNAMSQSCYDVILMDMHMPEMDGLEATRLVRERFPQSRQPAIIAVTADAMQGDRERYLAAGMDHYVSKPLGIEELKQTLVSTMAPRSGSMPEEYNSSSLDSPGSTARSPSLQNQQPLQNQRSASANLGAGR